MRTALLDVDVDPYSPLPPKHQLVLLMRQLRMPYVEIGRRLGFSKSRAQQYYRSAVRKLRYLQTDEGVEGIRKEWLALFAADAPIGVATLISISRDL